MPPRYRRSLHGRSASPNASIRHRCWRASTRGRLERGPAPRIAEIVAGSTTLNQVMDLGLVTFADLAGGLSPEQRMRNLLEEARLADELGLELFAVGEHHRPDFLVSSPAT